MVRRSLGLAFMGKSDFSSAEIEFGQVIAKDPKDADALMRLGLLHAQLQQQAQDPGDAQQHGDKAARFFERVLALQPQHVMPAKMLQQVRP